MGLLVAWIPVANQPLSVTGSARSEWRAVQNCSSHPASVPLALVLTVFFAGGRHPYALFVAQENGRIDNLQVPRWVLYKSN